MSTLFYVLCAVIGALSPANAESLGGLDPVMTVQLNVQRMINRTILMTKTTFENERETLARLNTNFSQEAHLFKKPILDEIFSKTQKINFEIGRLNPNPEGYITADCLQYYEHLISTANFVESNTSICVDDKLKIQLDRIASITTMFEQQLTSLNSFLDETQHCSDNITDVRTAFKAMECSRAVRVKANQVAEMFSRTLKANITSLKTALRLFQTSLSNCSKNNGFCNFKQESSDVVRKTRQCIEQNNQRNNYDVHV